MMESSKLETLELQDKGLKFFYRIAYPKEVLPRGVLIICQSPDDRNGVPEDTVNKYTEQGIITAFIYPFDSVPDINGAIAGYSALIDKIREKYRYLPIIAMGTALSSVSVRELAYCESERLGGVILVEPTIPLPSGINILKAKIISAFKGKEYKSDTLGSYGIALSSVISYLKKAKELDSIDTINEYPKHMPTLIVNAANDTLFENLDDAYVSGVEKAVCSSENELTETVRRFTNSVIDGVNDAISSDSFIYRGTEI